MRKKKTAVDVIRLPHPTLFSMQKKSAQKDVNLSLIKEEEVEVQPDTKSPAYLR